MASGGPSGTSFQIFSIDVANVFFDEDEEASTGETAENAVVESTTHETYVHNRNIDGIFKEIIMVIEENVY